MVEVQTMIVYGSLFISLFFEVFLLITYLEVREELKLEETEEWKNIKHFPTVSIIVPCFNEERTLGATVRSLLNLDYSRELLSIMLVDDGSTDGTAKELDRFKDNPQVKTFSKTNGGKHSALNFALEHVESDLVGCLDADSFVNPDALKKIVPFFADEGIMAVTPSVKVFEPKSIIQYVQKIEYSWGIFLRRMLSSLGALYVTPGPFSIFRTQVFRELGGYREAHHTEDLEMALRMQKNRYRIANSHGAHVYTITPSSLSALLKQRVRWTYGFLNNALDYKSLYFNRRYGNIGFFVLPIATTSIFSSIYLFATLIWNSISKILENFTRFRAVGFQASFSTPSFDWYFFNTSTIFILTLTGIALTLVILFLSMKMAEGKFKFSRGIIYYLLLYIIISPLWLTRAVFNTIFRRKVAWR